MTATPQDAQSKLSAARSHLVAATSTYPQMVKKYGSDWTKWPTTSHWYQGLSLLAAANTEIGQLVSPTLTAAFEVS